ncbi:hypothetical protein KM043_008976, partial [Ampulex compressa]
HVYLEICLIARKIDSIFGAELSLEVVAHYLHMGNIFYYTYELVVRSDTQLMYKVRDCISLSIWSILHIVRIFYVNRIAESFSIKTKEIQKQLYKLANYVYDTEVREDVSFSAWLGDCTDLISMQLQPPIILMQVIQFVMQVMLRPSELTGMGLFTFGYNFLRGEYCWCLNKLAALDDTLEELGIRKEYQGIRRTTVAMIIVWCIYTLIVNYIMFIKGVDSDTVIVTIFQATVLNHIVHANTVGILKFGILVSYAGSRFDRLNEHIRDLIRDEDYAVTRTARAPFAISRRRSSLDVRKCRETIETLMHVHSEICRIARKIDAMFGAKLALEVAAHYFLMANMLYTIYEAQETQRHLCKLANSVYDADVREDVVQFLLQTMYRPPKFTGMGIFVFGYNFLQGFYASMGTVLVVMLQMYDPLKDAPLYWRRNSTV